MQGESRIVESVHHKVIREKLFSFCENKTFSDICIIASDDERFHTHKCILSASSDYFMAMIGGHLKEEKELEVKIHEFNGEILKTILAFMYTGTIELQSTTVEDVLRAANFFQIKSLIIECYTFMGEELNVRNCLGIAMFAEQQGLMELYKNASEFASKHFEDVRKKEEFLELKEDQLCKLISSKQLCVSSEEIVFLSIIKWIEYDQTNRDKSAYNLFSKVRYQFLSYNFIKQHRSKLQMYQNECLELVFIWIDWHMCPDNREVKPMDVLNPKKANELVLVLNNKKQIYNSESNSWTVEENFEIPNTFYKVLRVNSKLVFYVGEGNITCIDLNSKENTKLPLLPGTRREFGLVVLNGELYAVGGTYNTKWCRYANKFDFSSGKWQTICPMITQFINFQVASAGGLIYIIGNEGVMECFNPDSNEWTVKPSISMDNVDIRRGFPFIEVNHKLYVVGNKSGNGKTNKLYIYDPLLEKWEIESHMRIELLYTKCTSWNNQLIVFGGYDSCCHFHNIIQKYNPTSKTWTLLASPDNFDYTKNHFILNL